MKLSGFDFVLIIAAILGLGLIPLGLWRCAHGWLNGRWNSPHFRSGLILVVVGPLVIFGSLFLALSFGSLSTRPKAELYICTSNLKNIVTALEMYQTDHPGSYPNSLHELTPNYLKTLPECPAAKADTYSTAYLPTPSSESVSRPTFRVGCGGSHHVAAKVSKPDHPAYDSVEGKMEL